MVHTVMLSCKIVCQKRLMDDNRMKHIHHTHAIYQYINQNSCHHLDTCVSFMRIPALSIHRQHINREIINTLVPRFWNWIIFWRFSRGIIGIMLIARSNGYSLGSSPEEC